MPGLGVRLLAAAAGLVADMKACDPPVTATLERDQVHPPGVWVTPQTVDILTLSGGAVARFHLHLVVPASGDAVSHKQLAELLDRLTDPDGPCAFVPAEPVDTGWALVVRENALPAYRLAIDVDI